MLIFNLGGINPADNPSSSGGISAGGIVGIVLAILIVLVLGLVVYKFTCSGTKSTSSFTPSWTSKKKTAPTTNTSVGFDNPMALGNVSYYLKYSIVIIIYSIFFFCRAQHNNFINLIAANRMLF